MWQAFVYVVVDCEFYQMQGLACSTEELSAFQEGLHFMELAHQLLSQLSSQQVTQSVG